MAKAKPRKHEDIPPDNVARIVLFDAMYDASNAEAGLNGVDVDTLFDAVIRRLSVLVPRELHVHGERPYVEAKIQACIDAGILQRHERRAGFLLLGPESPRIRYPDGSVHAYEPGLEAARERLDADDDKLRRAGFDVRRILKSPANIKKSERYRNLVESMREHGFISASPIIVNSAGTIVDGVARLAAAVEAEIPKGQQHTKTIDRWRDTPLQNALLAIHLNADRLTEEDIARVHEAIENHTQRSWTAIQVDLDLTQAWRRPKPTRYSGKLEVELVPFEGEEVAKVQISKDGTRVGLRSVMTQAGLPEYGRDVLLQYISYEEAGTQLSGKPSIFVRIDDCVRGIERMMQDRQSRRLKVNQAWEDVRRFLQGLLDAEATEEIVGADVVEDRPDGS